MVPEAPADITISDKLRLCFPAIKYAPSYADALEEGLTLDPPKEADIARARGDFATWLEYTFDMSRPVILPDGTKTPRRPFHLFWLVDDHDFLGQIHIRPALDTPHLLSHAGHIGYSVRTSARKKGYGRMMLESIKPFLRTLGLSRVLVTCRDDNTGSIRIIEGAGGLLENKVSLIGTEGLLRRYWIEL